MGCSKKKKQALSWSADATSHLFRASRQSNLSANDTGDNEMKPEDEHIYPGIYLPAKKTPENLR